MMIAKIIIGHASIVSTLGSSKAANDPAYCAADAEGGKNTEQCDKRSSAHHRQKTYDEQDCCQ
jgi:hypothetical protein